MAVTTCETERTRAARTELEGRAVRAADQLDEHVDATSAEPGQFHGAVEPRRRRQRSKAPVLGLVASRDGHVLQDRPPAALAATASLLAVL